MTQNHMEALLSQFAFLSDQALEDESFDPSLVEELMELFEQEAFVSWSSLEKEGKKEEEQAEMTLREAENYLNSIMDAAVKEFESFEKELHQFSQVKMEKLIHLAENTKKISDSLGIAANKYIDAALISATASMEASSNKMSTSKIHPQ